MKFNDLLEVGVFATTPKMLKIGKEFPYKLGAWVITALSANELRIAKLVKGKPDLSTETNLKTKDFLKEINKGRGFS